MGVSSAKGLAHADAGDARAMSADSIAGLPSDFRARFTKANAKRFMSRGHLADRFDVDVWLNDAAKTSFGAAAGEFPVGAILVKEQFESDGTGSEKLASLAFMEKREKGYDADHGDWRYAFVTAGGVVKDDGKIPLCFGCHGDAPRDHVFRVD